MRSGINLLLSAELHTYSDVYFTGLLADWT